MTLKEVISILNSYFNLLNQKNKKTARLQLLFLIGAYLVFGFFYLSSPLEDPLSSFERFIFPFISSLILIFSYFSSNIEKHLYEISRFIGFGACLHLVFLAHTGGYTSNYLISLLITAAFFNFVFRADYLLVGYDLIWSLIIFISVFLTPETAMNNILFLISFYFLLFISCYINRQNYITSKSLAKSQKQYKKAHKQLKHKSSQYEKIFNSTEDAVFLLEVIENKHFIYKEVNSAYANLIENKAEEVKGKSPSDLFNAEIADQKNAKFKKCLQKKDSLVFEETLTLSADKKILQTRLSPIFEKDQIIQIIGISRDITEKKRSAQKIEYLMFHDNLTGLYNRDYLNKEIEHYDTENQLPLGIIMGDVNGLKITNDAFGHKKGDELLKNIADVLKDSCRKEDMVARWGGDEFVILLPQIQEKEIQKVMKRIYKEVENLNIEPLKASISLGYSLKTNPDQDIEDIFKKAEAWMYKRKLTESENFHSNIISTLKKTLNETSHENYAHCQRIKNLTEKLGEKLNLSEEKIIELKLLAELHDLGKVAIKDSILEKEAPLNTDERELLEQHTEIGYKITRTVPELRTISRALLYHHEWWDGSGYPHQLSCEEIPLLARILSVVNEYDKLTHYYPHVKTVSQSEAKEILLARAGSQFDPQIVDIFVNKVLS